MPGQYLKLVYDRFFHKSLSFTYRYFIGRYIVLVTAKASLNK